MIKIELVKNIKVSVDQPFINKIASAVSSQLKVNSSKEVTLAIVADKKIRELNKKCRKKDKVTDVLSFGMADKNFISPDNKFLGDIIICYPQLKRQAKINRVTEKKEFALLLVHGLLHLLDYHHESNIKEAAKMEKLQKNILNTLF